MPETGARSHGPQPLALGDHAWDVADESTLDRGRAQFRSPCCQLYAHCDTRAKGRRYAPRRGTNARAWRRRMLSSSVAVLATAAAQRTNLVVESKRPKMSPLRWNPEHRIALFVATIFGACMGFIVGLRRVDPSVVQNFYWLWLAVWVISGAVLGAIGAVIRQMLRRP